MPMIVACNAHNSCVHVDVPQLANETCSLSRQGIVRLQSYGPLLDLRLVTLSTGGSSAGSGPYRKGRGQSQSQDRSCKVVQNTVFLAKRCLSERYASDIPTAPSSLPFMSSPAGLWPVARLFAP